MSWWLFCLFLRLSRPFHAPPESKRGAGKVGFSVWSPAGGLGRRKLPETHVSRQLGDSAERPPVRRGDNTARWISFGWPTIHPDYVCGCNGELPVSADVKELRSHRAQRSVGWLL